MSPSWRVLVVPFVVSSLLFVAACSDDNDGEPQSTSAVDDGSTVAAPPPTEATDSSAETASGFPVTIEHKYGETTVPTRPERVVALGATDQDPLLALGVVPVAVANWRGSSVRPWNEKLFAGAAPTELDDAATAIDFEAIAAADPDLIVSLWSGITESDYTTLSEIAPTIAQSGEFADWGAPWDVNTRIIGQATGRVDEAEALIADIEGMIAASRDAHPELAGRSITIAADFADGNLYITPPDDARYDLLEGLGMNTAPAELDGVETLSFEQVDQLNAVDVVFWITLPDATIASDALYLAQPIHTEGRDIFPAAGSDLGLALTFGTVLSIPYTLEQLVPMLSAAVDADPSTAVAAG